MKRGLICGALALLLLSSHSVAGVTFTPSTSFYRLSGRTTMDITFGGYDATMDPTLGWIQGESKLEYDVKAWMTDVGLEADINRGLVLLSTKYDFSVAKGNGKLRDRDWVTNNYINNVEGYDPLGGDTLSDTQSPVHIFQLEAKGRVYQGKNYRVYASGGYWHEKIGDYQVFNIDGFYRGWLTGGPVETYNETFPTPILSYEITYQLIQMGLSGTLDLARGFSLGGEAKAGRLSYDDFDNHILRSKIGQGSGSGYGGSAKFSVDWKSKRGFGASAFVQTQSLSASGKEHQYYYTGALQTPLGDVSQTVKSNQTSVGLEFIWRFGPVNRKRQDDPSMGQR